MIGSKSLMAVLYLMFAGFGEEPPRAKQLTIHFILNGHPQRLFTHTFAKSLTRQEAEELCEAQWGGRRSLRFFSLEGVQLVDEELEYVRNNQRIYVSRGEEFDSQRNFGEYTLLRTLGEGGFGRVWLARSSITGEEAAIKLIKLEKITGARDIDMVFREVENLKALTHPNIVKILNCYTLSNMQLVVVMEYLPGGELLSLLKAKGKFTEGEARRVFGQIVAAVAYCHRENIIHRDLKLQNILVADKEALRVKVADFGISGVADAFNPEIDVGTLRYMAPEVLSKKERINTAAVDVWACGIMLFCMIYGHLPFVGNSNSQTIQAIVNGDFSFPARPIVTHHCKNIISSALQLDPRKRISAADLQLHLWMSCDLTILPEEILPELPPKPKSREKRKQEDLKRTVVIPKRLQKEKQKLLEELKNMGSKRRIHHSEVKPLRVGSQEVLSPRYKLLKTKEEDSLLRGKELSVLRGSKQEMRAGKDQIKMGKDQIKVQGREEGRGRVKKRVSLVHALWR